MSSLACNCKNVQISWILPVIILLFLEAHLFLSVLKLNGFFIFVYYQVTTKTFVIGFLHLWADIRTGEFVFNHSTQETVFPDEVSSVTSYCDEIGVKVKYRHPKKEDVCIACAQNKTEVIAYSIQVF